MKNRIGKTVPEKLTLNQLERKWRKEQRSAGVKLVILDTSEIKGRLLKATLAYCEDRQIAFSQFMHEALVEHFQIHGFMKKEVAA